MISKALCDNHGIETAKTHSTLFFGDEETGDTQFCQPLPDFRVTALTRGNLPDPVQGHLVAQKLVNAVLQQDLLLAGCP